MTGDELSQTDETKRKLLREFDHANRRCTVYLNAVIPGEWSHYTGYVETRLAEKFSIGDVAVDAPGGITYTDDRRIGFETAHAFDYNLDSDGEPLSGDLYANYGWDSGIEAMGITECITEWTPDDVEAETRRVAERVDTLEGETDG